MSRRKAVPLGPETLFNKFLIVQLDTTTFQSSLSFQWIPKKRHAGADATEDKKDKDKEENDNRKVIDFCFPESNEEASNILKRGVIITNIFSFVLTDSYGNKTIAYCKRIMRPIEPICYCIIARKPYFKLFDKVMIAIQEKYEIKSKYSIHNLLSAIIAQPIPKSSTTIEVTTCATNSATENWIFPFLKPRTNFDHIDYEIIHKMKPAHIIRLFEFAICESRVILLSKDISVISNGILALSSLLSPLVWQHIFISILPSSLMPYVAAPIPFLVGILESSLKLFYQQPTEQVILYNLDTLDFIIDPDTKSLLPYHIRIYLDNYLKNMKIENPIYNNDNDSNIRKPFYSVIYHLFKNYTSFMSKSGANYSFFKDQFLDSPSNAQNKKLLEVICNSQMVEVFFGEKEIEFSDSDMVNCLFLNDARETADEIPYFSRKKLGQYDCPACLNSTISFETFEVHSQSDSGGSHSNSSASLGSTLLSSSSNKFIIHKECLKCRTCELDFDNNPLDDRIHIKRINNGDGCEAIKIYCTECRSKTFMNKIKVSSSNSKQKFYNLFKNDDFNNNQHHHNQYFNNVSNINNSNNNNSKENNHNNVNNNSHNNNTKPQQIFPSSVSNEIHSFKFRNNYSNNNSNNSNSHKETNHIQPIAHHPPPQLIIPKKQTPSNTQKPGGSLSSSQFAAIIQNHHNHTNKESSNNSNNFSSSPTPSPPVGIPLQKSSSLGTASNNQHHVPTSTSPSSNNINLAAGSGSFKQHADRVRPPLPPSQGERKERALEQMKQRNIHVVIEEYKYDTTSNSNNNSNNSNTSNSNPISFSASSQNPPHVSPRNNNSGVSSNVGLSKSISNGGKPLIPARNFKEVTDDGNTQKMNSSPPKIPPPQPHRSKTPPPVQPREQQSTKISPPVLSPRRKSNPAILQAYAHQQKQQQHQFHHFNGSSSSGGVQIKKPLPIKLSSSSPTPIPISPTHQTTTNQTLSTSPSGNTPPAIPPRTLPPKLSKPSTSFTKLPDCQINFKKLAKPKPQINDQPSPPQPPPPLLQSKSSSVGNSNNNNKTPPPKIPNLTNTTITINSNPTTPSSPPAIPARTTPPKMSPRLLVNNSNHFNKQQQLPTINGELTLPSSSPSTSSPPLSSPSSSSPRRLNKTCYGCSEALNCKVPITVMNNNYYHQHCYNSN